MLHLFTEAQLNAKLVSLIKHEQDVAGEYALCAVRTYNLSETIVESDEVRIMAKWVMLLTLLTKQHENNVHHHDDFLGLGPRHSFLYYECLSEYLDVLVNRSGGPSQIVGTVQTYLDQCAHLWSQFHEWNDEKEERLKRANLFLQASRTKTSRFFPWHEFMKKCCIQTLLRDRGSA